MGQKIHPLGFRVGITKRHQSEWYARFHKHQYAQTVLEDRLIRQTLGKVLPEILQKKLKTSKDLPRISHIKIERGLIPYEIGIQIHAENCQLIKSAIDHLEVSENILANSLRNEFILQKASAMQNSVYNLQEQTKGNNLKLSASSNVLQLGMSKNQKVERSSGGFTLGKKNFTKRKNIIHNFRQRFLENILIFKKGENITRKFKNQPKSFNQGARISSNGPGAIRNRRNANGLNQQKNKVSSKLTFTSSQKVSRFANTFFNRLNIEFATALQTEMKEWNKYLKTYKEQQLQKYGVLRYAPLGYNRKWSLNNIKKLQKKPVGLLIKLLKSLQKKALKTMENLRQEFIVLGTLSKIKSFDYFQQIRFIKTLRKVVQELQNQQNGLVKSNYVHKTNNLNPILQRKFERSLVSLNQLALTKKLTNIDDEIRKIKLIDYLQNIVQQHRQKNLYLYLATIADAQKYLKKIQRFTKEQVNFLFGFNFNNLNHLPIEKRRDFVKNHVSMAIKQAKSKNELQAKLQDVFLKQFQKQRLMCFQNIELTPKISLKFYSVKQQNLTTKASIVADSIVDSLEKRQAFRRVIKKAKEDLMKTSKVKGVKIQVSGRLNGAEIARSEWVRAGRVPLQTLRANIDYCYKTAQTIYGIIGVKVWIYKGYTTVVNKTEKPLSLFPVTN